MNELQRASSERIGKPVIVSFVVRMGRINYASCLPTILYVHSNARRAGLGPLSSLCDLGAFDRIRRWSLRKLVGECLILRCFAFLRGAFFGFGHGQIEVFGEVAAVSHRRSSNQTSHWMTLFPHRATSSEA